MQQVAADWRNSKLCGKLYGKLHGKLHGRLYGKLYGKLHGRLYGKLHGKLYGNLSAYIASPLCIEPFMQTAIKYCIPAVLEATSNQVGQFGSRDGMKPSGCYEMPGI